GGDHTAIGPGQRELSLKRLFGHEHDAQRGALPRRPRRGQERDLARRVTGGRPALRPRGPPPPRPQESAADQRQRCRCSPNELACRKHWQSLALSRPRTSPALPGDTYLSFSLFALGVSDFAAVSPRQLAVQSASAARQPFGTA